jgi:hypothetical protein
MNKLNKNDPKIAYFGDQYSSDVYGANSQKNWDGFAIIEEMSFA